MAKCIAGTLVSLILSATCPLVASAEMPAPRMLETAGAMFPIVTAGEGEPVLFVHGALGDYRKWDGLWEDVADGHRFMAYTQRWFGTTEWPSDKPYSWDVHTADLVAVLQAIGEPVHLVGLSNGGQIVLRAAGQAPDLVRSVVVYEPTVDDVLYGDPAGEQAVNEFFGGFGDVAAAVEAKDYDGAARELIEVIYGLPKGGFDSMSPMQKTVVLDNAHTMPMLFGQPEAAPLDCETLKAVRVPTLVITGSETLPMWRLAGEAIAGCIPGASLAVIEGVGHNGTVVAKDAFVKLTLDFIDAQ